MQFECSYMMSYDEASDTEELAMSIDSVSVIPSNSTDVETIYSAEGNQLGKVHLCKGWVQGGLSG